MFILTHQSINTSTRSPVKNTFSEDLLIGFLGAITKIRLISCFVENKAKVHTKNRNEACKNTF